MAVKNKKNIPTTREIATELIEKARDDVLEQEKRRLAKQARGFMNFVREQGVVGLAVGLSIGTAATVFVKSIVDNMINPLVGVLLPGGSDLNSKFVCLSSEGGVCVNKFAWGAVASNFISFLAVAFVIYFVVKGFKLDKLDKKKEA